MPQVRRWLRSLPTPPRELAEPFAGGAIVGLSALFEGLTHSLTLVEKDEDVSAVWQVILSDSAKLLATRIVEFDLDEVSVKAVLARTASDLVDKAFATILRNRVQRGGIMAPGASLLKRGENGKGLKSRWYPGTLRKRIEAIHSLRQTITFIRGDGIEFIRYNSHRPDAAFFIDPPYTVAGRRLYSHSDLNHEELFRVAASIRGDFLMTYDDAAEVEQLARHFGFDTHSIVMKNTHHEIMKELLVGKNLDWIRKERPASQESFPENEPGLQVGPQ